MRLAILSSCLLVLALAGCHERTPADKVGDYFEKKAAAMDALADRQPTAQAKQIYHDRAQALRDEGKEREQGLRAAHASGDVPRMSNIEASLNASGAAPVAPNTGGQDTTSPAGAPGSLVTGATASGTTGSGAAAAH